MRYEGYVLKYDEYRVSHVRIDGYYFIPYFLFELESRGLIEIEWREKAAGSYTKLIYGMDLSEHIDYWKRVLEHNESSNLLIPYPVFALYSKGQNKLYLYFSEIPDLVIMPYLGEEKLSDIDLDYVKWDDLYDQSYDYPFFDNPLDGQQLVASYIKASQKKVLSANVIM